MSVSPFTKRSAYRPTDRPTILSAFTLVELLVVIGIIALLISILLPSLNSANRAAKTTVCLSQMRQIGLASTNYLTNNKNYLPPSYYFSLSNPSSNISYFDIMVAYLPKTADKSIWTCPEARDGTTAQFPLTYGNNRSVHVWYWADSPVPPGQVQQLKRVTQIRRTSEVIALGDAAQSSGVFTTGGWLDWSDRADIADRNNAGVSVDTLPGWAENSDRTGANYHLRFRHQLNKIANTLFVDVHAESVKKGELTFKNLSGAY